ncbi:MAG: hypothetical protein M0R21_12480 [Lentimicrobiaceae bacterium]|jgi:hypothetical protein|nr:hypothetical protein [Lentimicrobiaceae bacterium]
MFKADCNQTGIIDFNKYLLKYSDESSSSKISENYFPADVVIDAYKNGFSDGKKAKQEDFESNLYKIHIEKFIEKATKVYLSAKSFADYLKQNNYKAEKFYLNLFHRNPKVVISIKEELLLDDKFVIFAYTKINEMQNAFLGLFNNTLDISLVCNTNLDEELLQTDGFSYSENVC